MNIDSSKWRFKAVNHGLPVAGVYGNYGARGGRAARAACGQSPLPVNSLGGDLS